jgi:hypothetical protein
MGRYFVTGRLTAGNIAKSVRHCMEPFANADGSTLNLKLRRVEGP